MKLSEQSSSEATVEEAFAARCEQSVREQACRESHAISWDVSIVPATDGSVRIQVDRVMPSDVPDFIKKFLGETIQVRQVEEWGPANAGGGRTANVKVTIKGQPASMVGKASLQPTADGSMEIVEGDVKVTVPFLGKKIEPEIAKAIASALKIEQRVGLEWIRANHG
jgi:uncharacterized Zn-binding protein involved in type VI secretion